MIIDSLSNAKKYYCVHPLFSHAFEYIQSQDIETIEPGKYELDGDQLKAIPTRTLVVGSDMDYTPASFKQAYVSKMQNASLVIIKNSRHGVVIDQPEAFNLALEKFLNDE